MKIDENYMERLANAVAKTILDAIENLSIEDVNMHQIGYNKAIDDFVSSLSNYINLNGADGKLEIEISEIDEIAEQLKK